VDFSKHIQKAEEALRRRNYDFAVELFRQLVDLDPDLGEARGGLRRALRAREESKKGGKFLKVMAGALPLSKAKGMAKLGKFDAAARALEDYLAKRPLDADANLELGLALESAGHLRSARAVFEFVAEIAPKNALGLRSAGAMLQRSGDPEKALDYYERALKIDPRDQDALKARKDLAAETALNHSRSDAVKHSRELIKDKDTARDLERRQRMHLSDEELREEVTKLEEVLAEKPDDVDTMVRLAEVYGKLKDNEAALELAEGALTLRAESFELVVLVGTLKGKVLKRRLAKADKDGDPEAASRVEAELVAHDIADQSRRVALRPGDATIRIELGKRLLRSGDVDLAIAELQRCQADPRVSDEAVLFLAHAFQEKGMLDLARKQYTAALERSKSVDGRAKEILYQLGVIAEQGGETETARGHFMRIFEVDIGFRDVSQKMNTLGG
jgi:tetratricopeptide (TPR) repeat protein